MTKQLRITPAAVIDLENITEYLLVHWNNKVASAFLARFDEMCIVIQKNPQLFPLSPDFQNVRKVVLTAHNTFISESTIRILIS